MTLSIIVFILHVSQEWNRISKFLSSFFFVSSNLINWLGFFFLITKMYVSILSVLRDQGQGFYLIYEQCMVFQVITNKFFILCNVVELLRRVTSTYTTGFREMLPDITVVIISVAFIQNI